MGVYLFVPATLYVLQPWKKVKRFLQARMAHIMAKFVTLEVFPVR